MTDRPSNFDDARRRLIEQSLICRCGAMNSPTTTNIHLDVTAGRYEASCDFCGQGWNPLPDRQTKEQ